MIAASGRVRAPAVAATSRVARLADHLDVGLLEQAHDALAGEHLVVGDHYAHGSSHAQRPGAGVGAADRTDPIAEVHRRQLAFRPSSSW